jgi:hypothetical protein
MKLNGNYLPMDRGEAEKVLWEYPKVISFIWLEEGDFSGLDFSMMFGDLLMEVIGNLL